MILTNVVTLMLLFTGFFMIAVAQPLPLALILILLAVTVSMFTWVMFSKWIGLSLTLIYLGGMMVVFLYVSFLTINFKLLLPKNKNIMSCIGLLFFCTMFQPSVSNLKENTLSQTYSSFSSEPVIFLILYLLLCLLAVVKFTQCFKGALIKKF